MWPTFRTRLSVLCGINAQRKLASSATPEEFFLPREQRWCSVVESAVKSCQLDLVVERGTSLHLSSLVTNYFQDEYFTTRCHFVKDKTKSFQPFWLLTSHKEPLTFTSELLTWFHFNKYSNDQIFTKDQRLKKLICQPLRLIRRLCV